MSYYSADLAYIHDVGFGGFARNAARGLLEMIRGAGHRSGLVVDLGCGTGLWAAELLRAGYNVLGVDLSADMLRFARRRAPRARFVKASVLAADLPSCVAVTALGEVLNYTFDPANSLEKLRLLFRRVHRALVPGGVFIFDIAEPGQIAARRQPDAFWQGDDWAMLRHAEESDGIFTRDLTIFRRVGRQWRRSREVHPLRLYRRAEILAELRHAGFTVHLLRRYGDTVLRDDMAGFLAKRS